METSFSSKCTVTRFPYGYVLVSCQLFYPKSLKENDVKTALNHRNNQTLIRSTNKQAKQTNTHLQFLSLLFVSWKMAHRSEATVGSYTASVLLLPAVGSLNTSGVMAFSPTKNKSNRNVLNQLLFCLGLELACKWGLRGESFQMQMT